MVTSGIVNLTVSGKLYYVFSTETLSADSKVSFTVDKLEVDNGKIIKLPHKVLVNADLTIDADRVKLHDATIKTKDETSRLIIKNSWYSFADTMQFHIPILPESWINLEDVGTIAGFRVKGLGSTEVLISGKYENPVITGKFSGTNCLFNYFSVEECSISTSLKDRALKIELDEIKKKSLKSKGSWVSVDFNKINSPVEFKIAGTSGDIRDGVAALGVDIQDVSGKFQMNAKGLYSNGIYNLNGKLNTEKVNYKGVTVADSVVINIVDAKKDLKLKDTVIRKGESSIVLKGKVDKKTLKADISANFGKMMPMDLIRSQKFNFKHPQLDLSVTGLLNEPDIKAELSFKDIVFSDIKAGDFTLSANYNGKNMDLSINGNLGDNIKLKADTPGMNFNKFKADINVDNLAHRVGDTFFKFSAKANMKGKNINTVISKAMLEKSDLLIKNIKPITIEGPYDNITINKAYFGGKTVNFTLQGEIEKLTPDIRLKGSGS